MGTLLRGFSYSLRRLGRTPGYTTVVGITVALSVGSITMVYAVVDAVLFRPLPYNESDRLVQVWTVQPSGNASFRFPSAQVPVWRAQDALFVGAEPYTASNPALSGEGGPEQLASIRVGGGLMNLLGVNALLGRTIQPADAGRDDVVVLSESLWRRRFSAGQDIIGRTIRLDERSYEVVGVMAKDFRFPYGTPQIWMPLPSLGSDVFPTRVDLIGRLAPGLTIAQAQVRADAIGQGLGELQGAAAPGRIELREPLAKRINPPVRQMLLVLFAAAGGVLLIACANVASLVFVRVSGRALEMRVRAAHGASRVHLVRELLTESTTLVLLGAAAGILLAMAGTDLLAATAPREFAFMSARNIRIDHRVIAMAMAATAATAGLVGLWPALWGARGSALGPILRGMHRVTADRGRLRLRGSFVVVQIALSLMLLVASGLLTSTFVRMTRADSGFETDRLASVLLSPPSWKYRTAEARLARVEEFAERLRAMPGITGVSLADGLPPNVGFWPGVRLEVDGRGVVLDDPGRYLPFNAVDAEFFGITGIPLLAGRTFSAQDGAEAPPVIIMSRALTDRMWPGGDPVGQRVRLEPEGSWYTVVGVAGNVFQDYETPSHEQFAVYSRSIREQAGKVVTR